MCQIREYYITALLLMQNLLYYIYHYVYRNCQYSIEFLQYYTTPAKLPTMQHICSMYTLLFPIVCQISSYQFGISSPDKKFSSENFMKKYMDVKSLKVVQAEEIVPRLEVTCPFPPRVRSSVKRASTEEDAARELFKHFQKQGTPDTIRALCDVMMGLEGYANMNHLGEKMKNDEDLLLPSEDI